MDNITLYEAMTIIDEYLTEKSHMAGNEKVHGTAARIAVAKSNMNKNAAANDLRKYSKTINPVKKVESRDKYVKHMGNALKHDINAGRLTAGANPVHQSDLYDKVNDKTIAYGLVTGAGVGKRKGMNYISKIGNKALKHIEGDDIDYGDDEESLRKLKKKYMPESIETKLRVYEAYDNGIITESEKNQYLEVLEAATSQADNTVSALVSAVKKDETKIKNEINKLLKVFYNEEKDKPGPAPFKYKGQDIIPDNWRDTIKKAPTVGSIDYTGCDIPMIMLSYNGSPKTWHDHILFFEEDFLHYLIKEKVKSSVLNKYNFEVEDYPGIFITLKK